MSTTFALNLLCTVLFSVSALCLLSVAILGAELKLSGPTRRAVLIPHKVRLLNAFVVALVLGVLGIVAKATYVHGLSVRASPWHLGAVVVFVASFVAIRFWITGDRHPLVHRPLVAVVLGSYVWIMITGMDELWKRA